MPKLRPIGQPTTHESTLGDDFLPRRAFETDEEFTERKDIFGN